MGRQHAEVPSPGVAAFIGFAAQAKPAARFVSVGASALDTPSLLVLIQVLMTTPPFIGSFCMSVGAQSTAQSWHTDQLTHYELFNLLIVAQRTLAL